LPKEWTVDQIRQFQDYFDALMSGNLERRRMVKFMPADFKLTETRQPPLKDSYDEWLARVICYAFSVPASAFVSQVNRATSETLRMQATQEGLVPLKAWVKSALDSVVQVYLRQPDLEFVWVGDDAIDPLEQAQTLNILVSAGIKTREEARADLGLAPEAAKGGAKPGVLKLNPYHDERGRFTIAQGAVDETGRGQSREDTSNREQQSPHLQMPIDGIRPASVALVSCAEAFRQCVQSAVFARSPPIRNCTAALGVCKSTGLPTIFGSGIVGQN